MHFSKYFIFFNPNRQSELGSNVDETAEKKILDSMGTLAVLDKNIATEARDK